MGAHCLELNPSPNISDNLEIVLDRPTRRADLHQDLLQLCEMEGVRITAQADDLEDTDLMRLDSVELDMHELDFTTPNLASHKRGRADPCNLEIGRASRRERA